MICKQCQAVVTSKQLPIFSRTQCTETLVKIYQSPRRKIPEDMNLQQHRYLNLTSHNANKYFLTCQISHLNYTYRLHVHESVHPDTIMKVTNKMQLYRLIYFSVSGDVFAHHQEHLTVFTISGSIHPSCCRLVYTCRQQLG